MVAFESENFKLIRDRADVQGTSFAEQVRILVIRGIQSETGVREEIIRKHVRFKPVRPRTTQPLSQGFKKTAGASMLQTMVSFHELTFAAIRQRATANRTSFAEEIRTLVEWGLDFEETGPVRATEFA